MSVRSNRSLRNRTREIHGLRQVVLQHLGITRGPDVGRRYARQEREAPRGYLWSKTHGIARHLWGVWRIRR